MARRRLSAAVLISTLLLLACASKGGQGTGNYYLVFEVQDGAAMARYRYQVSYQQWFRFPEGTRVRITINNNFLQDIRPNE